LVDRLPGVTSDRWSVELASVNSREALGLLREYFVDVADRYFLLHEGRRATSEEVETALVDSPSADLAPPTGVFLLGWYDAQLAGCAGVRLEQNRTVELTRVFVRPAFRGTGGGRALLAAVDQTARNLGATRIILDTRLDLTEARTLYTTTGYQEIPAYKQDKYAEIWYSKALV
jgi:GNAT superfamily N-acetyltransferase